MIRIELCAGTYGTFGKRESKHRFHAMLYRDGRIVASESAPTVKDAVRRACSYFRARRMRGAA